MGKIATFLMFKERGEEAVHFYVSLFKNSKVLSLVRSRGDGPIPEGALLNATFELAGQQFMATDGGPNFDFTEGMSIFVNCDTQEEIDDLWEKLSEGGEMQPCGWLRDRYGVSWQIVPTVLGELMQGAEPARSRRVMEALFKMTKIDINTLRKAYEGR